MLLPMQIPGVDEKQIAQADSLLRTGIETRVKTFAGMTWDERFHLILNDLWHYGTRTIIAIVIFIAGRWLIRRLVKMLNSVFKKHDVHPVLRSFTRGLVNIMLYTLLIYVVITIMGVPTTMFVALFATAGLAIGMALSGVFQNFAGGVMILLLKPFDVGDWIELQGQAGTVTDIRLFNTLLRTTDNKTILLPNGSVSTSIVNNYNCAHTRRLEWTVTLDGKTDFAAVQKVIMDLLRTENRLLPSPAPEVVLGKLNSGTIDVTAHGWVTSADYWDVFYKMNEAIYKTLPEKGFSYPTAAMAVTLQGSAGATKPDGGVPPNLS